MKLLKLDLKANFASLIVETPLDILSIARIIKAGDAVRARTARKPIIFRNSQTIEGERRQMVLTILIEKIMPVEGRLRLLGTIKEGPADVPLGAHHTIEVEPGLKLDIYKVWKPLDIERLKKVCQPQPEILFCMIDREGADFFVLHGPKISPAGSIAFKKIKGREEQRDEWYSQIADWLSKKSQKLIVVGGPGFERENLLKWIVKNRKELSQKIWLEHASTTGKTGVQEILKRSGNKLLKQTMVAKETELVQELLRQIRTDGPVAYGKREVEEALQAGIVKMLLISEPKISEFESLIDLAESQRAEIEIITTGFEAGDMFLGIGGIGAFLRYKL